MDIQNVCGVEYLNQTEDNSIDLILTDPPYIISRDSGMDKHYEQSKPKESKTEKELSKKNDKTYLVYVDKG